MAKDTVVKDAVPKCIRQMGQIPLLNLKEDVNTWIEIFELFVTLNEVELTLLYKTSVDLSLALESANKDILELVKTDVRWKAYKGSFIIPF
ncbi:Hypothetical protein CINCED_3A023151 [Cinara cedri]|uniref:Uncharacterized protein n=1 Tax=Cinara cedri TaxID=506608 RepID=A0A5E4MHZ3_9HEMI|nr:Hypothetical protein CINCED_3A023151 [Cinara cedri]